MVAFDLPAEFHFSYQDRFDTVQLEFDSIYTFCVEFYSSLIHGHAVDQALEDGVNAMHVLVDERLYAYTDSVLEQHLIGTRPALLLPEARDHSERLFGGGADLLDETELQSGRIVDTSLQRAPSNLRKPASPFTGRNLQLHRAMRAFVREGKQVVNLIGPAGIGKSRLLQELGYILHAHHCFPDGVYFLKLKGIRSNEELRQRLGATSLGGANGRQMFASKSAAAAHSRILLLFDDADSLQWLLKGEL